MKKITYLLGWTGWLLALPVAAQETNRPVLPAAFPSDHGAGTRPPRQEFGIGFGNGLATYDIGGKTPHNLLLSRLYYGILLGQPVARTKWYGGQWEFVQELFGAWQYDPANRYLVGTTSLLRYNWTTGSRWVPFLDAGIGASATNLGHPDLGSTGQFNGQIGPGLSYFWNPHTAFNLQYRYMHNSSGGLSSPNQGINENIVYAGVSWFF